MAKYRFDQIAINSTEKKKPVEEDRFTYLGLEHLDSGTLKVTRFGSEVAPIGEKLVMQRGAGFCTVRSTPEREQAAVTFLKWLTEPEHNVEFVTRTGYMPVTREAFENELPKAIEGLESAKYASLYEAYLETQANYKFYVPPQLETYLSLETALEDHVRAQLALGRQDYLNAGETGLERISAERLEAFRELMER